jgi:aminoglycoside phosphotransferase (APT) family kinase protein
MAMHADEVQVGPALVRRLLHAQHPRWAGLDPVPVASAGTDNALFRLGGALAVRLPRIPSAAGQVAKEQRWLPALAPGLPLAVPVPVPVAAGLPGEGYPFPWSVCRWLDGGDALHAPWSCQTEAAGTLAGFVAALRSQPAGQAPPPGAHNAGRGVALAQRDAATRAGIAACAGLLDTSAALRVWHAALAAPAWTGPPTWLHGDLHAANLLVRDGVLAGVLDFGCLAAGDPACDLAAGWMLFDPPARAHFRAMLAASESDWARGRGWALSVAVIALPYYRDTNPALAGIARRTIAAILAENAAEGRA